MANQISAQAAFEAAVTGYRIRHFAGNRAGLIESYADAAGLDYCAALRAVRAEFHRLGFIEPVAEVVK